MQVLEYSSDNLALSLSNDYTSPEVIKNKNHFSYLDRYLLSPEMGALTIVLEEEYVSKDFLHDYVSYYALCFEKYPKFCKRVHFFKSNFNEEEFQKTIACEKQDVSFWDHYLGFIVVKPIPTRILGYTVLKTYSNGSDYATRNFWGLRDYKINFFGNEIIIKSLAFQEQDSVLAACATTAIWSMLNKAALDFHTTLKSPSQITKDAGSISHDGNRLFPNRGLNILQICQAIFNSGLEPEVKRFDFVDKELKVVSNLYLKKILNAYSPIGIPIILVISVPSRAGNYGLHAITVSGFKQNPPKSIAPNSAISWLANNIEKIYAHDDQWGPFARITFKDTIELETPWTDKNLKPTYTMQVVIPVYPKIRISYEDIEVIVLGLDTILTSFFDNKIVSDLVWDVKIDFSENFKKQIKSSPLEKDEKLSYLTKSMPKYLWIALCYIDQYKVLEFTFDATNVNNGMIGQDFICFMPADIKQELKQHLVLNQNIHQSLFSHRASVKYYEFLINEL